MLLSRDKSLAGPLGSELGIEDMYDLIEIVLVDAHNDKIIDKIRKAEEDRGH